MPQNRVFEPKRMDKFFSIRALGSERIELWVYSDIGEWEDWGDVTAAQISKSLAEHKHKAIDLRINSYGGVVTTAMAMYSALKRHEGHITAHIDGIAASAASFVAMAADKIIMPRNALMMIHNPWGVSSGEAKDLRAYADMLDKMRGQMIDIYAERSGLDAEKIGELLDAETWLTGDEAKEIGFADDVTSDDVEAYATASQVVYAGQRFRRDKLGIPEKIVAKLERREEQRAQKQKEVRRMEPTTVEELKAKYPELCEALEASVRNRLTDEAKGAVSAAVDQAVKNERARMQSIDEISATIPKELVRKAKYETGEDAANLALAALKAQSAKGAEYLENRKIDAQEIQNAGAKAAPPTDPAEEAQEHRQARVKSAAERLAAFGGGKLKGGK